MATLSRDEAWAQLCAWTPSEALRRHGLMVEAVMRAAATRYGAGASDERDFALAGLMHDADYERWPDEHPTHVVAWLRERGEDAVAHAVSAHYTQWGVDYETLLDKALLACDELTGFVGACCLVRPNGIADLKPRSVLKKLKNKGFAVGVDRHEVREGARLLGVELAEHVAFVIEALTPHGEDFGLLGSSAPAADAQG